MIRIKNNLPARLPSEYQELDYIESTGTQHINTGVVPNQDTSIELEAKLTNITQTSFLYGSRYWANTKWGGRYCGCVTQTSDYKVAFNYSTYDSGWIDVSYNVKEKNTWYQNKNALYINGTAVKTTTYESFSTSSMELYLFATSLNADSGINSFNASEKVDTRKASAKIYTCKVWDNTTLIRDFVPCYRKSDNVAGMYDLVNDVFYTNAGTGVFLMGTEVGKRDVNIKPMINGKELLARYIGNKLIYLKTSFVDTEFSVCPFPTSWTMVSGSNYLKYTSSNNYGEWNIECTSYDSNSKSVNLAFDNSDTTYWYSGLLDEDAKYSEMIIECPALIKPTQIRVVHGWQDKTGKSTIYGYNPNTNAWEKLCSLIATNTSAKTETFNISTDNYYSKFKVVCYRYSSSYNRPRIYEFDILSGTIRQEV